MTFSSGEKDLVAGIEASLAVGIGPITVFRYHHQASETWQNGQFVQFHSQTVTNGRREQVLAVVSDRGVQVDASSGAHSLPATAAPLTHWNREALARPLFNPQTGLPMRERVSRLDGQALKLPNGRSIDASRYSLSGDADLMDWYDADGQWSALRARATDGSYVDYRRAAT